MKKYIDEHDIFFTKYATLILTVYLIADYLWG